MLKQRIITALVLLAILLPAIFYPTPDAFGFVALVLITAGAWEWGKLNQCDQVGSIAMGAVCAIGCATAWYSGLLYQPPMTMWFVAGGVWVTVGIWLLMGGVAAWARVPKSLRLVGGVAALWVAWIAVAHARIVGINFLFSVLVLVWVADVSAYFAGRALGGRFFGRKLAPTISPGKTWEGACGGLLGVVVSAFAWQGMDRSWAFGSPSLYTQMGNVHPIFMVLAVFFLASMSIVGDLVESLFKRSAGVKDSSNLLPGHGGVLDRVDALLPVLPLAMMLVSIKV